MPDITISVNQAQVARLTPALNAKYKGEGTAGAQAKRFLIESLKAVVLDYEKGEAEKQVAAGLKGDF